MGGEKKRKWRIQGGHARAYLQDWARKERWEEEDRPVIGEGGEREEEGPDEDKFETSWVSRAR